jgi:DNA polymerase III subunit gamma/tau
MSYQVLARKWRPRIFREMVGQEHVLQALINALDHNRLHHAYLFTGTRGVGKTTIARILAKCLNCETGVSSEPCGQCSSCREIAEGRFVDLIEVDAASRTKVEDTRELLENVQYAPTRGRYKVYLIDEVHMLSNSSFNALLKTLEEPPPHVKFLLATTDPQKLPMTILSRCLQFNLKNMTPERIVNHLKFVLEQEMVPFEEPALWHLGRAADGSMRDAMSLTDQAISFGSGKITDLEVSAMLGTIDQASVQNLMQALIDLDGKKLLQVVADMSEHSPDYAAALAELLSTLHRIAIAQALPEALDNSQGDREKILHWAQALPAEDVQLFYQTALLGRRDLPLAPDPRAGFEMVLLRMLAFKPQGLTELPTQKLPRKNTGAGDTAKKSEAAAPPVTIKTVEAVKQSVSQPEKISSAQPDPTLTLPAAAAPGVALPPASMQSFPGEARRGSDFAVKKITYESATPADWPMIYLGLSVSGILQNTTMHCECIERKQNLFVFTLDKNYSTLFDVSHQQRLADVLSDYFKETVQVRITPGQVSETPAMIAERERKAKQAAAEMAIQQDPIVQQLISQCNASIQPGSIEPLV